MKKIKPLKLTQDTLIVRMRRLLDNEDFQVLQGIWLDDRTGILNEGKKHKREEDWARLDGFDKAIFAADKWASRKTSREAYKPPMEAE